MTIGIATILTACSLLSDNVPEAGRVHWRRDLDECLTPAAIAAAGKPTLVLFQEIPGCATCVGFGAGPLSHPLVVEWIEDGFVPVLIHNNKDGADKLWREHFDEAAWNNPVLRVIGPDGKDLVAREEGVWSTPAVIARIVAATHPDDAALKQAIAHEVDFAQHHTATFEMHCFWEGEAALGAIPGVIAARAQFLDGREVVAVTYHQADLEFADLVRRADALDCALKVYVESEEQLDVAKHLIGARATMRVGEASVAPAGDHTHALNTSPLRFVPLTPMQAMKVNAALTHHESPGAWLTPRQRALARKIDAALVDAPDALKDLTRPTSIADLWDYTARLEARLTH